MELHLDQEERFGNGKSGSSRPVNSEWRRTIESRYSEEEDGSGERDVWDMMVFMTFDYIVDWNLD